MANSHLTEISPRRANPFPRHGRAFRERCRPQTRSHARALYPSQSLSNKPESDSGEEHTRRVIESSTNRSFFNPITRKGGHSICVRSSSGFH